MKKINIFNRNTNLPSYRRMPVSRGFNRGGGIPLFSGMTAVIFALFVATPSFAEPTELDKKTVASKAYVDTKQDIIETGLVEFNDNPEFMLPAITTYDSTSGLVSNKIGILDWQTAEDVEGPLHLFSYEGGGYGSEMDNYVPTVRAVAESLQEILGNMPYWNALSWSNTQSVAINAYNSTFGNGSNNWAGSNTDLINGQFLANSLALKQNKLPEQDDDLIPGQVGSLLAPTTAGNVTQVALWGADGGDSAAWNIDDYYTDLSDRAELRASIPTIGAVEAGLSQKQNKMVCAGWDSETHTDEHCWLWSIE